MPKAEVEFYCCFCGEKFETEIDLPEGWDGHYGASQEQALCPKHSKVAGFQSNCSGCVGGWGECTLWKDFAYNDMRITEQDLEVIRRGTCPRRTNGTLMVSRDNNGVSIEDIDISDPAEREAGEALAEAILEYDREYHKDKNAG